MDSGPGAKGTEGTEITGTEGTEIAGTEGAEKAELHGATEQRSSFGPEKSFSVPSFLRVSPLSPSPFVPVPSALSAIS